MEFAASWEFDEDEEDSEDDEKDDEDDEDESPTFLSVSTFRHCK